MARMFTPAGLDAASSTRLTWSSSYTKSPDATRTPVACRYVRGLWGRLTVVARHARTLVDRMPCWKRQYLVPDAEVVVVDGGDRSGTSGRGVFNVASVSKSMTVWGVLALVDQGAVAA